MSRIRTIKPDFFEHEGIAELSATARLAFIGFWTLADREGRLEDRPKRIKAKLFPYEAIDIEALIAELIEAGFMIRYEVDGVRCLAVVNFRKHQRITGKEAEKQSEFPAPPSNSGGESQGKQRGNNGETSGITGKEGKGKEGEGDRASAREESTTTDQAPSENTGKRDGLTDEERALLGEAQKGMIFPPEDFPLRVAKQIAALVGGREQTDPAVHAAWLAMPLGQQARWCHAAMALTREKGIEQRFWLNYATKAIVRSLETGSDLVAERKREAEKVTPIASAPSAKAKEENPFAGTDLENAWAVAARGCFSPDEEKRAGYLADLLRHKGLGRAKDAMDIYRARGYTALLEHFTEKMAAQTEARHA